MPRRRNGQAESLEIANADCAGVDIGKDTHYVAVDPDRCPEPVRSFDAFTPDWRRWQHSCRTVGWRRWRWSRLGAMDPGLPDPGPGRLRGDAGAARRSAIRKSPNRSPDPEVPRMPFRELEPCGSIGNRSVEPCGRQRPDVADDRIARKSGFSRATCGSPKAFPRPYGALAHAEAVLRLVEAGPARPPDPASPPRASSGPYDVPSAGAVSSSLTSSKRCASASEAARSSSAGS